VISQEISVVDCVPSTCLVSRKGRSVDGAIRDAKVFDAVMPTIFDRVNSQIRRFSELRDRDCYFYDTPIESCDGAWVTVHCQRLLMLASYNYLGFISDDSVLASARRAIDQYGIGQHGSRLVSGTTAEHKALERELAEFMHAEDAIVFNSGYVTNLATIAAMVGKGDMVIGDEWNHACIVDGCKLSGADFQMFRHNDLRHLEELLRNSHRGKTLVAVDAVYSMEGDLAPIPEIVSLCKKYGALLMVDEAHSIGTIGNTGRGIIEHFGLSVDAIDIKMGTLSKSLGAYGGFIASNRQIVDFLRIHARGYVFSGALPPVMISSARRSLKILTESPALAKRIQVSTSIYRERLRNNGFNIYGKGTQIVPIACESEEQAFAFTKRCRELGVYVIPIVYPAVPMNSPRIRTNLTILHTDDDIRFAIEMLTKAGRENGVIG
jgi:8-amino-7-oxononanoate synthase